MESASVGSLFRKSSYSSNGAGNCVEVGSLFRKSSYSENGAGNCVEAGQARGAVLVRDTKDRDGGALKFPAPAWHAFTARLRTSRP